MTFYTPLPLELVFDGFQDKQQPLEEINLNGRLIQVERIDATTVRIVRLVSCSLEDYLLPELAPGQMIYSQHTLI